MVSLERSRVGCFGKKLGFILPINRERLFHSPGETWVKAEVIPEIRTKMGQNQDFLPDEKNANIGSFGTTYIGDIRGSYQ